MLGKVRLFAVAACLASPAPESLASGTNNSRTQYSLGYQDNYRKGFHAGYREGYASGYRQGANNVKPNLALAPINGFAGAVLGAAFGYWSDGARVYGGNPWYVYNDRDWGWDRVC
jgi:hypothetical protein